MVSLVPAFAPLIGFSRNIRVILLKHKSFHNLPKDFLLRSQHLQQSSRSCYVVSIISLISFPTTVSLLAPLLPNGLLIILQTSQAYSHLQLLRVLLSAWKALLPDTCVAHPLSFFRSLCYYIIFSMRPSLTTLHKAAIQHSKSTAYSPWTFLYFSWYIYHYIKHKDWEHRLFCYVYWMYIQWLRTQTLKTMSGFKVCINHLRAVWALSTYSTFLCLFPQLVNGNKSQTQKSYCETWNKIKKKELFWELNELIYVIYLKQCLAYVNH